MTDDYTPLTDEEIAAMKAQFDYSEDEVQSIILMFLADRAYWKRRAEEAEAWRKEHECPMPITRGFEWTRGY